MCYQAKHIAQVHNRGGEILFFCKRSRIGRSVMQARSVCMTGADCGSRCGIVSGLKPSGAAVCEPAILLVEKRDHSWSLVGSKLIGDGRNRRVVDARAHDAIGQSDVDANAPLPL